MKMFSCLALAAQTLFGVFFQSFVLIIHTSLFIKRHIAHTVCQRNNNKATVIK